MFAVTADDHHAECAHWFDKPVFYRPLVEGTDPLPGLHANTHLAQVRQEEGKAATGRYPVAGCAEP